MTRPTEQSARQPLALHVCCGPCATAVIERLREKYDVHAVWYNPNIHPDEEHRLRLEGMKRVAELSDVPLTVLEYDVPNWSKACAGLMDEPEGGARCEVCFRLRLERVAQWAVTQGIGLMTTTLTISPHKNAALISEVGQEVARKAGIEYLPEDFKKRDGFRHSVELSRRWGIYRQTWCGCAPSRAPSGSSGHRAIASRREQ